VTVLRLGVVVLLRIAFKKVMFECVSHSVVLAFGGLPPGCGFRGRDTTFRVFSWSFAFRVVMAVRRGDSTQNMSDVGRICAVLLWTELEMSCSHRCSCRNL